MIHQDSTIGFVLTACIGRFICEQCHGHLILAILHEEKCLDIHIEGRGSGEHTILVGFFKEFSNKKETTPVIVVAQKELPNMLHFISILHTRLQI